MKRVAGVDKEILKPESQGGTISLAGMVSKFGALLLIMVLGLISFATTARGMFLFFPEEILWQVAAGVFSFTIQLIFVLIILKIKERSTRFKDAPTLFFTGLISILFSYAAIYEAFSGDEVRREDEKQLQLNYTKYVNDVKAQLLRAQSLISDALTEAIAKLEIELSKGESWTFGVYSPYLKYLFESSGIDFSSGERAGGPGPIYKSLQVLEKRLKGEETAISGYVTAVDEAFVQNASGPKIRHSVEKINQAVDWGRVRIIIDHSSEEFIWPKFLDVSQIKELKNESAFKKAWLLRAISDIKNKWDSATILLPLLIAMALDGTALFIGWFMRDEIESKVDIAVLDDELNRVLDNFDPSELANV